MTEEPVENPAPHGYSPHKENYAKRLRRVEGQVRCSPSHWVCSTNTSATA